MIDNHQDINQASRQELQEYLEGRGFAVYDHEDVETLREAARLDIDEVSGAENPFNREGIPLLNYYDQTDE